MSPVALALAILMHALVAAALWWMAQQKPPVPPVEEAITVSFEQPKPPEPPPPEPAPKPPAAQPKQIPPPQALPPIDLGVRPPAPVTGDRPTQAPPTDQVSKQPPAPPPPPESKEPPDLLPQPEVAPPTPAPPAEARAAPTPAPAPTAAPTPTLADRPTPEPPTAQGLKKAPTPPPTQQAARSPDPPVKPAEPVPTPKPMPQQQALAAPPRPPPPAPKPELKPSPLSTAPSQRAPSASSAERPSDHRFVNPADTYARAKVADNYLSEVLRKIVGYRYTSSTQKRQGVTVVRIVIARDGRLLGATVISSSGEPEFDEGVLAGVRAGAPYSPLPDNIKGASAPFDLPLVSVRR